MPVDVESIHKTDLISDGGDSPAKVETLITECEVTEVDDVSSLGSTQRIENDQEEEGLIPSKVQLQINQIIEALNQWSQRR